jgi:hypothetical protein
MVRVEITNTLDSGAGDESIGYGNMNFEFEFDDGMFEYPTSSPAYYYNDEDEENPTGLWENDCGATRKECSGFHYYGGHGECAN